MTVQLKTSNAWTKLFAASVVEKLHKTTTERQNEPLKSSLHPASKTRHQQLTVSAVLFECTQAQQSDTMLHLLLLRKEFSTTIAKSGDKMFHIDLAPTHASVRLH